MQLGIPQLVTLMRRRVVAQLVRAERDGSLYLYAGCASLAGAVGLTLLPTRKNEEVLAPKELALTDAERRAAAKRAESEHAGLVQWALSTAGESESMHSNATTQAQTTAFTAREGLLMSRAPLEAWTGTQSRASVAADPSQTVARLRDTGVCRVDGCLSDGAVAGSNTCTAA